ncbi:hypothetical protein RND81_06G105000 [Saponaria officinalis]|uniref:Uncharacterized protein n=1 Tax=Saponaria officinalis TaxID=3572 RepID=A0AAW1K905_SAPOF
MGPTVRWPKKSSNPNAKKDTSKFCDFHNDVGHNTYDCIALRNEVAYLVKHGLLDDLIKNHDYRSPRTKRQQENQAPPPPIHEVKFITGGSEICGLNHSAAKRIAKEAKLKPPTPQVRNITPITFDDSDLQDIPDLHHDGLVISIQIGTARVRRVLVDGGSSVNLIMADVLKAMSIDEDQITKKSDVLVGFSGKAKNTMGEVYLPTYAEGISSYEKFGVLDCLSSYNAILGRPWIHNVKGVPSTYHQCIKVPTSWGTATIKGEQNLAQDCYIKALKISRTDEPTTLRSEPTTDPVADFTLGPENSINQDWNAGTNTKIATGGHD